MTVALCIIATAIVSASVAWECSRRKLLAKMIDLQAENLEYEQQYDAIRAEVTQWVGRQQEQLDRDPCVELRRQLAEAEAENESLTEIVEQANALSAQLRDTLDPGKTPEDAGA